MINTSIALLYGPDAYAKHLNDALAQASENPAEFLTALRNVIQARGTADLAAAVGMSYADFVRQLGSDRAGVKELALRVLQALR